MRIEVVHLLLVVKLEGVEVVALCLRLSLVNVLHADVHPPDRVPRDLGGCLIGDHPHHLRTGPPWRSPPAPCGPPRSRQGHAHHHP